MFPVLSVKPSWAYCIAYGPKRIECRSWMTRYRGWVWLHASASETRGEYLGALAVARQNGFDLPDRERLVSGGILAAFELRGVDEAPARLEPWQVPGCAFLWRVGKVVQTPYFPCRGRQGLWTPRARRFERAADYDALCGFACSLHGDLAGVWHT